MAHDNQISCIAHLKLFLSPSARDLALWRLIKRWQEPPYNFLVLWREEQEGWFPLLLSGVMWGSSLERFVICFAAFLKPLMGLLRGKESNTKTGGVLCRKSFLLFIIHMNKWHPVCQFFLLIYNTQPNFRIHSRENFSDPGMNTLFLNDMLKSLGKCTNSVFGPDT